MSKIRPKFQREILIEESGILHSVKYDMGAAVLDVTLTDGKRYRYEGIYATQFANLLTAKSAGKVYNDSIKTQNDGVKKLPAKPQPSTKKLDKTGNKR
jgi:hypothetical protein